MSAPARSTVEVRQPSPARWFLWIALPIGMLSLAAFPPFSAPDEPSHFYRSYAIATGTFLPRPLPSGIGSSLPASLPALVADVAPGLPHVSPMPPREIVAALHRPLDPENLEPVDYRTATLVSPLPYLPQAMAAAAGHWSGRPPLVSFYLARLANLLVSTLLLAFAIDRMPFQRWLTALLALLPMAVSLRASLSADAITMAMGFLVIALSVKLAAGELASIERRDWLLLTGASMALTLTKPVYFPLVLVAAIIPVERWPQRRRARHLAIHLAAVAVALAIALSLAARVQVSMRPDAAVDREAQLRFVQSEPLAYSGLMLRDYLRYWPRYTAQLVGIQLGWLDARLPIGLIAVYCAAVGCLWFLDGGSAPPLPLPVRGAFLAAFAGALLLVSLSQYLTFTAVRAAWLDGVQGRYFLPVAPALFVACRRPRRPASPAADAEDSPLANRLSWLVLLVGGGGFLIATSWIVDRYWL